MREQKRLARHAAFVHGPFALVTSQHPVVRKAGASLLGGALARGRDRRVVIIQTDEARLGERLRHYDGGGAVSATDVGDPGARQAAGTVLRHRRADPLEEVAKRKMEDMNAPDLAAAMKTLTGTARSMGIDIV